MKSIHQKRVEDLMNRIPGQEIPGQFTPLTEKNRILRAKLILEEALEKINKLGVSVSADFGHTYIGIDEPKWVFETYGKVDYLGVIDGCLDCRVICTGTLSLMGLPDEPLQQIVDEANLSKFSGPKCPLCNSQMLQPMNQTYWICSTLSCSHEEPKEAGPYLREDGKWVKPPYFVKPEIKLNEYLRANVKGWPE